MLMIGFVFFLLTTLPMILWALLPSVSTFLAYFPDATGAVEAVVSYSMAIDEIFPVQVLLTWTVGILLLDAGIAAYALVMKILRWFRIIG